MARRDCAENLSNSKFWLSQLPGGLPADFDYRVVKSAADAKTLILALPNCDRGRAAVELYRHCKLIGAKTAFLGLMVAWDHDHREIVDAFGSAERFVAALKDIAPPLKLDMPKRIGVWRGAVVRRDDPLRHSIGISWTRSRDVACWFALHDYVPALQPSLAPMVCHADIDRSTIVVHHDARAEQEVLVDVDRLVSPDSVVTVDGTNLSLGAFQHRLIGLYADDNAFDRLIAHWRQAAARYQHWKSVLELRRHLAVSLHPS